MKVPSTSILGRMVRKCLLSNYEWFSVPVFIVRGFSGGSVGKESTCNAGDLGLISGFGRSPREGNGSPLKYSCLRNPINRGAWWAKFHGLPIVGCNLVTKHQQHLFVHLLFLFIIFYFFFFMYVYFVSHLNLS